ncbi:hypothetical protein [Bacillus sp. 'calajunan']|uniref:hypothetical protein n=1 Tax=Bacillus sp. 'calajunan' TaxID=3447457 RepID=UPI003EE18F09
MASSIRILYRDLYMDGRKPLNFNWGIINKKSAVIITAAEWKFYGGVFGGDGRPHLGDANVYVTNIGPHDPEGGGTGGVEYYLHVEWPPRIDVRNINVIITITVLEDIQDFLV